MTSLPLARQTDMFVFLPTSVGANMECYLFCSICKRKALHSSARLAILFFTHNCVRPWYIFVIRVHKRQKFELSACANSLLQTFFPPRARLHTWWSCRMQSEMYMCLNIWLDIFIRSRLICKARFIVIHITHTIKLQKQLYKIEG